MIVKHRFYIKDMKMAVFRSFDQKNDDFLDREKGIGMGLLKCPGTPKAPKKHPKIPDFPQFFKKNALFLKIFAKKFGSLNFMRTFAIPNNKSGGGEMVDTLL